MNIVSTDADVRRYIEEGVARDLGISPDEVQVTSVTRKRQGGIEVDVLVNRKAQPNVAQ